MSAGAQRRLMTRYYAAQSHIYDVTRPVFLFGRGAIVDDLRLRPGDRVLEIGCGTGCNIARILEKVGSSGAVCGVDCSQPMLQKCRARVRRAGWNNVEIIDREYGAAPISGGAFDAVLMSYSLSMIPAWEDALLSAAADLKPGGRIGVVDFCADGPAVAPAWFRRWMALHHVRIDRPYLERLRSGFRTDSQVVRQAFGGLWQFFRFVGRFVVGSPVQLDHPAARVGTARVGKESSFP